MRCVCSKCVRDWLNGGPFSRYVAQEIWPGPERESDEALLEHAMQTGNTAYHPVGTCRMGSASCSDAVVDRCLRVHGVAGLRVADASIMPMIPSANVNAGTLMVGERAADFFLADAG